MLDNEFLLVYKDPYNGAVKSLPIPIPDIPPDKIRGTIRDFVQLYKNMLPDEKEQVHYMLIRGVYESAENEE